MIELRGLTKTYGTAGRRKVVADDLDYVFPDGKTVALLGRNGAGKSTLLNMIAGSVPPDRGEVIHTGTVSWPVGFSGSFSGDLTGAQNARFIARIYGVDGVELADFVRDFAELGDHFNMPVRTYSSGMRSRLGFGMSMGIDFDHYLTDEVTAVGDASFRKKSEAMFLDRMRSRSAIMVTHSLPMVLRVCDHVAILHEGRLLHFDDVKEGVDAHEELMGTKGGPRDED